MSAAALPATLPATMQVLERGWLSSNNVVFLDSPTRATVIDTGYVTHAAQTVSLIEHAIGGRRLARIINTHLHSDHCGGNAALRQRFGAAILIPPGHAAAVRAWDEMQLTFAATGQSCARFTIDATLVPGEEIALGGLDWRVIASAGHDPHQVMLWNARERVLLSADVLWENGFGAIFPEVEGESGFREQAELLECIAQLNPRAVVPGHGATFFDAHAALVRARARLAALQTDPARNARSVGRVLLKFHLLEVQHTTLQALTAHFALTHYGQVLHSRYFSEGPFPAMIARLVDDLVSSGVAGRESDTIYDR